MNAADLLALAERVEAATEPSRELDRDIALAIGWYPPGVDPRLYADDQTNALYAHRTPLYSASIDAAMSLVPEGCLAMVKLLWDGPERHGYAYVSAYSDSDDDCDGKYHVADYAGLATTPALALTAAALRARAASCDRSGEADETREAGLGPEGESAVAAVRRTDAQPSVPDPIPPNTNEDK